MKNELWITMVVITGCSTVKHPVFHATVVSATESASPRCKASETEIVETWCDGDAFGLGRKDSFGYFDEVVFKAQRSHKAKYLHQARLEVIETPHKNCAVLKAKLPEKCETK